jgi:murein L,D-transpeptidase YcbB/YkuD
VFRRLSMGIMVAGTLLLLAIAQVNAQTGGDPFLERRVEALAMSNGHAIGPYKIASKSFIKRFYSLRNFRPAWNSPKNFRALSTAIADIASHGLLMRDFHPEALGLASPKPNDRRLTGAEREIVLTDALIRLLYQLYYGKVDAKRFDANWNFERKAPAGNTAQRISAAFDSDSLDKIITEATPNGLNYERLRAGLRAYRTHAAKGAWPIVAAGGGVIKPGEQNPAVATIRQRLQITGEYIVTSDGPTDLYDNALIEAVGRFQAKHGIDVDGVLGPATISAMNVSAKARVQQIRVNLERARWISRALKDKQDLVIVNVAGFYLLTLLDGKVAWWTEVITGKPYHKTPMFTDRIRYVEFNPTWTIPSGILRNEILPKVRANPGYLAAKGYDVIGADGAKVDSATVNWSNPSGYRIVQPPGPKNALGLVKFMFPNKHNVYLHDTPSRQLFSKTGRAFSHGCVRVKDPMKFAEVLLGNRNSMPRSEIDRIVASKRLTRVSLKKSVPVAILYWTADPVWEGGIRFYQDVYKRDDRILMALDGPFLAPAQ